MATRASCEKAIRRHLDWLTARHGFPPALPSPTLRHRYYDRRAVGAWFDARIPDHLRAAALDAGDAPWAAVLDARANALFASETVQ